MKLGPLTELEIYDEWEDSQRRYRDQLADLNAEYKRQEHDLMLRMQPPPPPADPPAGSWMGEPHNRIERIHNASGDWEFAFNWRHYATLWIVIDLALTFYVVWQVLYGR